MKRKISKKAAAVILSGSLVLGVSLGGTLAWLTDKTSDVKNTFTVGNIDIELAETDADADGNLLNNSYKMIPGYTIEKDPTVTVKKNSEASWLFVKLTKTGGITIDDTSYGFDDFITYGIVDGWIKLEQDKDGNALTELVYYRSVPSLADAINNEEYSIIKDAQGNINQVTVKDTVTKEMMDQLTTENYPTLTFTAYASQYYKSNTEKFTVEEAWDLVKDMQ